ncbi:uncharacterized protein EV420DRAFT_1639596 [Desarmillaria tabescens]|uniref:Uncharacterized protein n=1 Tax=Armillaria tabescens TaxID=1929756 RepID=A0AA39NB97_ARMTA|nr:uncharacterized protein EV420DRAFT_1639596 [Desarmillaria tabescens]KAK0462379.1 hypothetical protein EV420DRAFT_1639596 [Desarmillaria tabescens]
MPDPAKRHGEMWAAQESWEVDDICYVTYVQNGQRICERYQCLAAHVSTDNTPPSSSPHLWRAI